MTRTRRMFLFIIMVTVLAIGAMAVIKYAGPAGLLSSPVTAIIAETPVTVTVSSSVTKQRWMEEMARRFMQGGARTSAGRPIEIIVKGVLSGDSMDRILLGDDQPVAWSPGESSWVAQLDARWRTSHGAPISSAACKPTVYTPSGIAMWRPMAEALGWPGKPVSWKSIIALASDPQGWGRYGHPEWGQLKLGYTHPQYSSAGLLFLASVIYGQIGKTEGLAPQDVYSRPVEEALSAMARNTSKYGMVTTNLLDMMARQGPDFLHAIAGFEEGVVRFNLERQAELRFPLAFVFPSEGTFWSDHPYCILDGAPWVTPERAEAAGLFGSYLRDSEQQAAAGDFLLRPLDATRGSGSYLMLANGTDPAPRPETIKPFEVPGAEAAGAIIDQFLTTKRKARVLLVLDVSSSMNGAPIRAATEATARFLKRLDPRDEVALMVFNDGIRLVSDFAPAAGGAEGLSQRVLQLVSGGGTNLNGAVCAATEAMAKARKSASGEGRLNGIVLLSDGADTAGAISETRMLQTCLPGSAEADGTKILAIAFGDGADREALNRIAHQTGGAVFAADPGTIDQTYLRISAEQ